MSIGIDIIEIHRIKQACERYGKRFIERILTKREIDYCFAKANPYESIASRFACKEAFAKAVGTGIAEQINWQSIEILRDTTGKPTVNFLHHIDGLTTDMVSLSLSHTHHYAVAVVNIDN
ncbi:MAG: hypothetical protein HY22_02430 [[Candidatus Thermochlorobacteriaceae] bacterium GBChlB]|jgi:holo-[acyl-carrier protein] synthase|nr:MAG: hypothetical protein HY22_02430 [[Candidatus Thermochlorobacteriaceae] bacterium GBChlB]